MNRCWIYLPLLLLGAAPTTSDKPAPTPPAPVYSRFGCQGYLNLSPDGRWLAYCANREVRVTEVMTGATRSLTDGRSEPGSPRWSPDGRRLAFFVERDGRKELRVWDRETGQTRAFPAFAVFTVNAPEPPQWSPDSRRVFFIAFRDSPTSSPSSPSPGASSAPAAARPEAPREAPARPGTARVYTSRAPKLSDAGSRGSSPARAQEPLHLDPGIARLVGPKRLMAADVETGQAAPVMDGPGLSALVLSPDGRRLAVMGHQRVEASDQFICDVYLLPAPSGEALSRSSLPAAPPATESATDATGRALSPVIRGIREEGGLNVSWAPDSTRLAFGTHGLLASGDVYVVDAATGSARNQTEKLAVPPGPKSTRSRFYEYDTRPAPKFYSAGCPPLWTRDGRALLCIGQGDLWRLPVSGGGARNLTRAYPHPIDHLLHRIGGSSPLYAAGGTSVFAAIQDPKRHHSGFCRIDLTTGAVQTLQDEPRLIGDAQNEGLCGEDVSLRTGQLVYTMEGATLPPEAWLSDTTFRAPRPVTHLNPPWNPAVSGTVRLLRWKTLQGKEAEGVLILPPGASRSHQVPMIVGARGGVTGSGELMQRFIGNAFQEYYERGYALLLPDIPMTFGQPAKEIAGAVLPALDAAIRTGVIDGDRLGVTGHSYGGYTVNVLITQTHRFKAAVSAAGPADWVSMYLSQWGLDANRVTGTLWQSREQYVENSPVFFLDRVTTPLLLLHGTADTNCPVEQSWEMFQGLRRLGKTAVLVEYPGAGHTLDDTPEIAQDYRQRSWDWFDKYLKPKPAARARLPLERRGRFPA